MKTCAYCGHDNDDAAVVCAACRNQKFETPSVSGESVPTATQSIKPQAPVESKFRWNMLLQFLPSGKSKVVFVLAVTAYAWMMESIIAALMRAFRVSVSQVGDYERHGPLVAILALLALAPVVESLALLGLIELSGKLRAPVWIQVVAPACVLASLHLSGWPAHAFVVAPSFLIDACSYLYWRPLSKRVAYTITVCIHSLSNLIPAISVAAYTIRHA